MSAAAVRLGDISTGHDGWVPRPNTEGSSKCFVDGKPQHRLGDAWATHCKPNNGCHDGSASSGSSKVFADGKAKCRVGDSISCGDSMANGSSKYFIS